MVSGRADSKWSLLPDFLVEVDRSRQDRPNVELSHAHYNRCLACMPPSTSHAPLTSAERTRLPHKNHCPAAEPQAKAGTAPSRVIQKNQPAEPKPLRHNWPKGQTRLRIVTGRPFTEECGQPSTRCRVSGKLFPPAGQRSGKGSRTKCEGFWNTCGTMGRG